MRKKTSNFCFEKFAFFVFFVALALVSAKSALAQDIMSDSSNILQIKATSTMTKSKFQFVPSASINSLSLQAVASIAAPATTISIFEYLSSTSLFKMLDGVLNYNKSLGNIGIGTTNPLNKLQVEGNIHANGTAAQILVGNQNTDGDVHFGASGMGAPANGTQDYGFYAAHNAYRGADGNWYHSRTATIPAVRFTGGGGVASGTSGFRWDYSANSGAGAITWTNLMQLTTSGNLGIGTTTPQTVLDVNGLIKMRNSVISTSSDVINKGYLDSALSAVTSANYWLANGTHIYNSNTGNVGIGTTNPRTKLHISSDATNNSQPNGIQASTDTHTGLYLGSSGNTVGEKYGMQFGGWTDYSLGGIFGIADSSASYSSGDITFDLRKLPADTALAEVMRVTHAGNVGIGLTNPSARLHIYGNGTNSAAFVNGNVGIGTVSPNASLDIYNGALVNTTPKSNHYRNVYSNYLGDGTVTGTLKVVLPKMAPSTMIDITIKGYDYTTNIGAWEVRVSGYVYSSGGWYGNNYKAQIIGSAPFSSVRLGTDGAKPVILLGNTGTKWSYGNIEVSDVTTSYSSIKDWGTDWSSAVLTSESGITISATPLISTYVTSAGNFGIGTTAPETALDVNGLIKMRNSAISTSSDVINKGYLDSALGAITAANYWTATGANVYNSNTGNIGIGITNPGYKLDVSGNSRIAGITQIESSGDQLFALKQLGIAGTAGVKDGGWNYMAYLDSEGDRQAYFGIDPSGNFVFNPEVAGSKVVTYSNLTVSNNSFTQTGSSFNNSFAGNVGIATTNPLTRLYVNGAANEPSTSGTTPRGITSFVADAKYGLYAGALKALGEGIWLQASNATDLSKNYPIVLNLNGGPVGVGILPAYTLDIKGDGNFNNNYVHNVRYPLIGSDAANKTYVDDVAANFASTSSSTISYWNANGTKVYNNNSGNVGIGTSNPSNLLHLNSSSDTELEISSGAARNSEIYFSQGSDRTASISVSTQGNMRFYTNLIGSDGWTERLTILNTNGFVGIGTISPAKRLDVAFDGSGIGFGGNTLHNVGAPSTSTDAVNKSYVDSIVNPWETVTGGIAYDGHHYTRSNIGVGTYDPLVALHVTQHNTSTYPTLNVNNLGAFAVTESAVNPSLGVSGLYMGANSTDNNSWMQAISWPVSGSLNTGNLIIQPIGGNVGIGTTNPLAKLNVNGNVIVSGTIYGPGCFPGDCIDNNNFIDLSGVLGTSLRVNGNIWSTGGNLLMEGGRIGIGTFGPMSVAKLQIGNPTGGNSNLTSSYATGANFFSLATGGKGTLGIFSTDAAAAGKGGSILLGGETGTSDGYSPYPFAKIMGAKEITGASHNGYLAFFTTTSAVGSIDTERMRINSSGNVMIGTTTAATYGPTNGSTTALTVNGGLYINGPAYAAGGFQTGELSDRRSKHNIKSLGEEDYQKILKLRPVSFTFNNTNVDSYGFIAQEVKEIFPESVTDNVNGMMSLSYTSLIAPTVSAVQEQEKKIQEQDTIIHILLDRVNKLEKSAKIKR